MNLLIIGGDSQIGGGLKTFLINSSFNVYTTTRRKSSVNSDTFFLNIENPDLSLFNMHFDYAVICAAQTNIIECEINPEKQRLINVINTAKIIDFFKQKKTYILYLSSNAVFNGDKAFYRVSDATCPNTNYGRFKYEIEKSILDEGPFEGSILRLTKVIGPKTPFVTKWKADLNENLFILAYTNRLLSPVSIREVLNVITKLLKNRAQGLYHLGGDEEISYFDYAKIFFKDDKLALNLIRPIIDYSVRGQLQHNSLTKHLPF